MLPSAASGGMSSNTMLTYGVHARSVQRRCKPSRKPAADRSAITFLHLKLMYALRLHVFCTGLFMLDKARLDLLLDPKLRCSRQPGSEPPAKP